MKNLYTILLFGLFLIGCENKENKKNGIVESKTGRIWMDKNLGASRVALSIKDSLALGNYFQWGRGSDGHQLPNSKVVYREVSNSDSPGNAKFIDPTEFPYDWRIPQNNNLWQGKNGINNPCPKGFRLPTAGEWAEEMLTWDTQDDKGAYDSPLKLPAGGFRGPGGYFNLVYDAGFYQSSTIFNEETSVLFFNEKKSSIVESSRSGGVCVRCIKD
jgi:hypothetical protein